MGPGYLKDSLSLISSAQRTRCNREGMLCVPLPRELICWALGGEPFLLWCLHCGISSTPSPRRWGWPHHYWISRGPSRYGYASMPGDHRGWEKLCGDSAVFNIHLSIILGFSWFLYFLTLFLYVFVLLFIIAFINCFWLCCMPSRIAYL